MKTYKLTHKKNSKLRKDKVEAAGSAEVSDAIPFDIVADAIRRMKYGSRYRVMFTMLALTGCRIRALDNMFVDRIFDGVLHWHEGKSTNGLRKERLPDDFIRELEYYRERDDVCSRRIFGVRAEHFDKMFRREVRPLLGGVWCKMIADYSHPGRTKRYRYRLKGLRKNFQTLEFAKQLDKWKDAGFALEMTSKKMRHQSTRITAYHYIENFEEIDAQRNIAYSMAQLIKKRPGQKSLIEFGFEDPLGSVGSGR